MKTRTILILAVLAGLAAVSAAAFLLSSSFLWAHHLVLQQENGLPEDRSIWVMTRVETPTIHQGDVFPYFVEVWYNPDQIAEIDKSSLENGVDLKPFEIRDIKESEFDLDATTRVYRREYQLQLITGKVDYRHTFPSIVVRYKPKGSEGLLKMTVVPEPVFVTSRLPVDTKDLQLIPLKGQITDESQKYLPGILWALGGFVAVLGVVELAWRAIPQWRESAGQRKKARGGDALVAGYRSLSRAATSAEPRRLVRQVDRLLRIALTRKEKVDWLEEPDFDRVAPGIRSSVASLLDTCQKAYSSEEIERGEVELALSQLDQILGFYFGNAEVRAWRG